MTEPPARVGRYRIDRVLGRGAMGVIYRAHDPEIERTVAIKLIRADLLDGEERTDYLARFRHEAQAAGRCAHPNIVALFDYALHDGNPFLVMEYVEGASLAQLLERGRRFSPMDAAGIVLQALAALEHAHGLGVVHRDMKPANILLPEGRPAKVTDFGISRIGGSALTQGGSVVGTPSYMSPEQCRGDEVDARSDLFSTGVVLFELLSGERPFRGRTFTGVVRQLLAEEAPSLHDMVPAALAVVVARALTKAPAGRFQSAAEMAEALDRAVQAAGDEATVVTARPPPALVSPHGQTELDEAVLTTLQRQLAEYVGPIAKVLVGSAVRKAADVEALCALLAQNIDQPDARASFLRTALQQVALSQSGLRGSAAARPPTIGPAGLSQATLELARSELARLIGPLASLLVKRAAASHRTAAEFWQALAQHIERPEDREAFLRRQPRE